MTVIEGKMHKVQLKWFEYLRKRQTDAVMRKVHGIEEFSKR